MYFLSLIHIYDAAVYPCKVLKYDRDNDRIYLVLKEEQLEQMLMFANAAAALITMKKGAIRSMPEKEEVEALMNK